jgi:hypothetical protein
MECAKLKNPDATDNEKYVACLYDIEAQFITNAQKLAKELEDLE